MSAEPRGGIYRAGHSRLDLKLEATETEAEGCKHSEQEVEAFVKYIDDRNGAASD